MKTKFWSTDRVVSFSAMFISLITLIIFVRQTNIMDQQSRLSLMPYLAVELTNGGDERYFSVTVYNYGVGPAVIEKVQIIHKGIRHDLDFVEFAQQRLTPSDSVIITNSSNLIPGIAIPAGEDRLILRIGGTDKSYFRFMEILGELNEEGFDYEIQYRSIYQDRWRIAESLDYPEEL